MLAIPRQKVRNPSLNAYLCLEIERAALQMLAHDVAGSDDASVTNAQKICDIIIVDLNNREIPIKVSPSEYILICLRLECLCVALNREDTSYPCKFARLFSY